VRAVRQLGVGHNGSRIAVEKNDLHPFFSKRFDRLGPGVVELACLTDHDRSRADDQHLFDVISPRHRGPHITRVGSEPISSLVWARASLKRWAWDGSTAGEPLLPRQRWWRFHFHRRRWAHPASRRTLPRPPARWERWLQHPREKALRPP